MQMTLENMKWTRRPADFTIHPDRIEIITEPHTDLWQRTYYHFRNDNAPVLQIETEEKYFSFIVKTDLSERTVLDKFVQFPEKSHLIVFLKPWSSDSEYISVGRRFKSEAGYYISKNNLSEKLYWTDY